MIETSNILAESLSQALETMAFLTAIQASEKPQPQDESIFVQIDFDGSVPGSLQILAGKEVAYALAARYQKLQDTIVRKIGRTSPTMKMLRFSM